MTRNKETLQKVGEALYGPLWQTPLADDLHVAPRTVRRWAKGDFEIPAGIWSEMAAICAKRGKTLQEWVKKLE